MVHQNPKSKIFVFFHVFIPSMHVLVSLLVILTFPLDPMVKFIFKC